MIDSFQNWLFPELRRFGSRVSGRRALQLARSEALRSRRMIAYAAVTISLMIAANLVIKHVLAPRFPILEYAREVIFILSLFALVYFHSRESRRALRKFLQVEGVPICVACGYDTTGIDQTTCPECGKAIIAPVGH